MSWFYGVDKFMQHIKDMGMKLPKFMQLFWKICWQIITPIIIAFITITTWASHEDDHYLNYAYPSGAQALGWFIELFPLSIVFFFSIIVIIKKWRKGEDFRFLLPGPMMTPKRSWGPRKDSGMVDLDQKSENL